MYLITSLRSYHSRQFYKCDDSEDARIHKVWLYLIFFGFARALKLIHGPLIHFNSWCAALFPTPNQRKWKESWSPLPNTTSDSEAQHQWLTIFLTAYLFGSNRQGIHPMANIRIHLWYKKRDRWRWPDLGVFHGLNRWFFPNILQCAERAEVWICNFPTF